MRLSPGIKAALSLIGISAGAYFAYEGYSRMTIDKKVFTPIKPSRVNLVAVNPDAGFKIIVANQVAQLAEIDRSQFGAADKGSDGTDSEVGTTNRKRIPLKEMLQTLTGDAKALSAVIKRMNDLDKDDAIPPVQVKWSEGDLKKALAGDPTLTPKLEKNLNIKLDGTPPPYVDPNAIENGIVIEHEVTVDVNIEGKQTKLVAIVPDWYRPRLSKAVEERYLNVVDLTDTVVAGFYKEEAAKVISGSAAKEDIKASLSSRIGPSVADGWADGPNQLLKNTEIVVNEKFITGSSYRMTGQVEKRQFFDLTLDLSAEGRDRLWKFSRGRKGFQLLLIVDGIAIAAPKIDHELNQRNVVIRNMPDEVLLKDAVRTINLSSGESKN